MRKKKEGSTCGGYGIGKIGTMYYLNRRGFFLAITYQNVRHYFSSEADYERKN